MTLFDFDPQFRETAAIFRLLQLMQLRYGLAEGRIFRWFAVNIPMDLLETSTFYGDLDLIACLRPHKSESRSLKYLSWEVKLVLIDKAGRPRSLKRGKTHDIVRQLKIHRRFGSPEVSLLEMFLCEAGAPSLHNFPSPVVFEVIRNRVDALRVGGFGYKILPFQHDRRGDEDYGTFTIPHPFSHLQTISTIVRPMRTTATGGFLGLMQVLDEFADSRKTLGFYVIVFCKWCRRIESIAMKDDPVCPSCGSFLI